MNNIGVAAGIGFAQIIQGQQRYIDRIKAVIQANNYTFDLTTTINNLQEHGTINGRIIDHKDDADAVFFITAVMYKPDTGWWILNQQQTDDYNTRPRFWFDISPNIFRHPERVDYGLSEQYIDELSNTFVEPDKKEAIRSMCQNIGSKSMEQFAVDNTIDNGTPWHNNFEPIMVIPENDDLPIGAQYGIPYFLVGKCVIGANITFYHNIASRWFFMTKAARDEELTRDKQSAILASILSVVEKEQEEYGRFIREAAVERERLAREAAERERLAREAAAERERLAREAAERERLAREAAERERLAREAAAMIAVSGVRQQEENAPIDAVVIQEVDEQPENNITAAVIAASVERERIAAEERITLERAATEAAVSIALERTAGEERIAAAERDRIAAAERDRIAAAERDRIAAAERDRIAAAESAAAAERDHIAAEERDRISAAAERDRIAAAERDRIAAAAERDRIAAEERDRIAAERDRIAAEERDRIAAERERTEQDRQITSILAAVLAEEARYTNVREEEARRAEIQRQNEHKQQLIQEFLNTYIINFKIGQYNTIQETIKKSNAEIYILTEQKKQLENKIQNVESVSDERLRKARQIVDEIDKATKEINKINGYQSRVPLQDPKLIERRNELYRTIRDYNKNYADDILIVKNANNNKELIKNNNQIQIKIRPINDNIQAQNTIIAAQQELLNEANKQIKQQIVNYLNEHRTPNIIWSIIQRVIKTDQIEIPAGQDENFLKTFLQQAYNVDNLQRYSKEQIAQGLYNLVKPPEQPRVDAAKSVTNKARVNPRLVQNPGRK
jgi:hypothetical protein